MKFNGVIFDLDGTLAYTLEDIADSMNKVLIDKRWPVFSYDNYKLFVGRGIKNLVKQTIPVNYLNDETIDQCYAEMIRIYSENCLNKTHLYKGIYEVVLELKKRGLKLAVFSNKAHELTMKIVNALFGTDVFDFILGARSSYAAKPDPEGALIISSDLEIKPDQILFVGDSDVDMITANNAGMYPLGVAWGYRNIEDLQNNKCKSIVKRPEEILELIQ